MKYIEVKIYTTKEGLDPLTGILMDMGIAGFVIEDSGDFEEFLDKKNSYDWDYVDESVMQLANVETNITAYLEYSEVGLDLLHRLREAVNSLKNIETNESDSIKNDYGRLLVASKVVNDEDWKDNWKEFFKPAKITDRIVVKPTWEEYRKTADDELVIEIDPGMAFGTGTHPTTTLCIRLLEKYIAAGEDSVLDVGCGSGILSIAAALLDAREIKGIEIDPIAVEVAKANISLNNLTDRIDVSEGDLTKGLDYKADIVVANLMADLVIMLSEDVAKHLKGKSVYISSGILIEKQKMVEDAIKKCGFEIIEIAQEGEWCAIAARL